MTELDITDKLSTRLDARAVTFVPETMKWYHGALGTDYDVSGRKGSEYHPIAKINKQAMLEGDLGGIITPIDYESYRGWERAQRSGDLSAANLNKQAALNTTSLANITRVELSTTILNEMYKEVFLHLGANMIPVPKLKHDYNVTLHVKTRGKDSLIKKRQKAQTEAPEFVQTNFDLANYGKLQRVIDIPDEDELTALLSPTKHMLSDISQVLSQDINSLILEDGIKQFKTRQKGSWSNFATGGNQSGRSPLVDLAEEGKRIKKNHGRANIIAMNSVTYAQFVGNTYVRGYEQMLKQEQPGVFTFSKLPGYTFLVDEDIDDGVCAIYAKKALTVGDGPMVTEAFRDAHAGTSGHVLRKWIQPLLNNVLKESFGSYMTGL